MKFLLGKKLGMTTIYGEKGKAHNATLVECVPNKVSFIRTEEKDGYTAVRLLIPKTKKVSFEKEFRVEELGDDMKKGKEISVEIFEIGDKLKVSGTTKAKGFQGVMKRHNFHGSPNSHGHKHDWRAPGSIGCAFPEHVLKGRKMAGRMGGERVTTKNLEVVLVDKEKNIIGLKGAVPGVNGRIVELSDK